MSSAAPVVAAAARTALDEFGTKGEFKRTDAVWRNWIGEGQCVSSGSVVASGRATSHRCALLIRTSP